MEFILYIYIYVPPDMHVLLNWKSRGERDRPSHCIHSETLCSANPQAPSVMNRPSSMGEAIIGAIANDIERPSPKQRTEFPCGRSGKLGSSSSSTVMNVLCWNTLAAKGNGTCWKQCWAVLGSEEAPL